MLCSMKIQRRQPDPRNMSKGVGLLFYKLHKFVSSFCCCFVSFMFLLLAQYFNIFPFLKL